MNVQSVNNSQTSYNKTIENNNNKLDESIENTPKETTSEAEVVYEKNTEDVAQNTTYTPDLEKIKSMKADLDQHMLELLTDTVFNTASKQAGGLKGILEKVIAGEDVGLDFEITQEDIEKAKEDISEDGYWGVEKTSQRLVDFAKALAGNDPSKIKELKDAIKKGFDAAEEIWGGELPEISQKTYDATIEKLDAWIEESNNNNNESQATENVESEPQE